jgi:hypothetical protein
MVGDEKAVKELFDLRNSHVMFSVLPSCGESCIMNMWTGNIQLPKEICERAGGRRDFPIVGPNR